MRRSMARSKPPSRDGRSLQHPVALSGRFGLSANSFKQVELAGDSVSSLPSASIRMARSRSSTRRPMRTRLVGCGRRRLAGAAQHALDARQQLARLERLGDVVVGAEFEADDAVDRLAGRGHHDDADLAAALAQPARQREAVLAGQADVEQDQLRQVPFDQLTQRGASSTPLTRKSCGTDSRPACRAALPRPRPRRYAADRPSL